MQINVYMRLAINIKKKQTTQQPPNFVLIKYQSVN